MKILLSWLLDYIDCSFSDIDIHKIIHLFNIRTAEIESYERVSIPFTSWFVGKIESVSDKKIKFYCPEKDETVELPFRTDAVVGKWYVATLENGSWRWVLISDLDKQREGIMPSVHVEEKDQKGGWRLGLLELDYVFDVDNKSINHRPDLWGHCGIAREISAFLHKPLKPLDAVLHHHPYVESAQVSKESSKNGLSVSIEDLEHCSRFAALRCDKVKHQDSSIAMAVRLILVGGKPINAVVDLTNYVMFDVGHPMHVFDANSFPEHELMVRKAKNLETLTLLDGQIAKLQSTDLVIANNTAQAVSLAGIMGGLSSGYQEKTEKIVLEAAGFDPAVIRKAAQRLKLRSEASMRFEKDLDPMQNITVLQRFLYLAKKVGVLPVDTQFPIISVGKVIEPKKSIVSHDFIQTRLGMNIDSEFVIQSLKKLDFHVTYNQTKKEYEVTVPTYRATKDINIAEDIVEEVIRSFGFENIIPKTPRKNMVPFDMQPVLNVRKIKEHLAYGMHMHELREYMMYDASFVSKLAVDLIPAVHVKSPLSENWTMLVTSLIPHLIKAVVHNSPENDHLRFFELNRTWSKHLDRMLEHKVLAGIIFDKKSVDFYSCKAELENLFDIFGISVMYQKPKNSIPVWYDAHQVAELVYKDKVIGTAGIVSHAWLAKVVDGQAFIFELDGEFLEQLKPAQVKFTAWSKYQDVSYDISLFVPFKVTSHDLCKAIKNAHKNIENVQVVDFFEKPEWQEHRAVTVRYTMSDHEKTMTKQDLDEIVAQVTSALKEYHVEVR